MRRRIFLLGSSVVCVSLLSACATLAVDELNSVGSKITPANINFDELYTYAERSFTAYSEEPVIKAKYPSIIKIGAPDQVKVRYFIEQDDKAKIQIITVRGTNNNQNLSEDLDIGLRQDRKVNMPVHNGFDVAAHAVYDEIKPYLKPGYKIYVTGHSLGGAIAAVLAIYIIEDGVPVERVVTFGQPRFTTADGVRRLSFLPLTRIVDENDIVPLVPPSTVFHPDFGPFEHVGAEVILLEGPDFVYLPAHDATRISLGEFWRSVAFADLDDHDMKKYLRRIASKLKGSQEVAYSERLKYVATGANDVHHRLSFGAATL